MKKVNFWKHEPSLYVCNKRNKHVTNEDYNKIYKKRWRAEDKIEEMQSAESFTYCASFLHFALLAFSTLFKLFLSDIL